MIKSHKVTVGGRNFIKFIYSHFIKKKGKYFFHSKGEHHGGEGDTK